MVFQSLLTTSVSSVSLTNSSSLRGNISPGLSKESPTKSASISSWRTFDRLSVQDVDAKPVFAMDLHPVTVKRPSTFGTWEGYFVEAERRCTEELCNWQVVFY